jgi:hypothetical protein
VADERIERLFADLDHLGAEDLGRIALARADIKRRASVRAEAIAAIRSAGRGPMLDDSIGSVEAFLERVYVGDGRRGAFIGRFPMGGTTRIDDRIAATAAVEDAVVGTLARDLVPAEVVLRLLEPYELIRSFHGGAAAEPTLPTVPRWLLWLGAIGLGFVVVVPFLFTSAGAIIVGILTVTAIVVFGTLILRRRPPTF